MQERQGWPEKFHVVDLLTVGKFIGELALEVLHMPLPNKPLARGDHVPATTGAEALLSQLSE